MATAEPFAAPPGPPRPPASPLGDRSVRLLLATNFLFTVGVFVQATALGKLVYDISGRKLDLGLLGLAEFAPAVALVLVTGHVADRFDRRKIGALSFVGDVVCAIGFALYAHSKPTAVGPIFALAVLFGAMRAFGAPAVRALPANVAPTGTLPKVTAFNSTMWQSALIIGPVAAGFLYAGSTMLPFAVAAVLIALAVVTILLVRLPGRAGGGVAVATADASPVAESDDDEKPSIRAALDGLRFIRRTPILLAAISLDLFAVLFGGAVALLPAIAEERLHVGAVAFGWLRAAGGVGAVLMAALLALKPIRRHIGRSLLAAVTVFGIATVLLGITRNYVVAFVAVAVLSGADMISVFVRATLVPLVTPDQVRGRVLAAENVFIGASNELGAFESGVVGQLFGTVGAVVSGGVLTIAVAALWWFRFPALRDVDRFTDLDVPGGPGRPDLAGSPGPSGPPGRAQSSDSPG